MGGEGAAREGEDAPAPPWAGAGVLGRESFSSASAFRPSGVTFLWLLTRPCSFVLHPGARRAHLSRSTSPGRGRCHLFGAGKEGTGREAGTERGPEGLGAPHPRVPSPPRPQQHSSLPRRLLQLSLPSPPSGLRSRRQGSLPAKAEAEGPQLNRESGEEAEEGHGSGAQGERAPGAGRASHGQRPPAGPAGLTRLLLLTCLSPPRTRSARAWSSSRRSKRPSPQGPGRRPWTDLCAESGSWAQKKHSLPTPTCGE